jgi:hypothetical protein
VLGEFAQREGIDVSDAEVEAAINERMEPYAGTPSEDRIREIFDTKEQRQQLENALFERRLVERLSALAEGRAPEPAAAAVAAPTEAGEESSAEANGGTGAPPEAAGDDTSGVAAHAPEITGAVPATEQEPGPLESAGGAAEVLSARDNEETEVSA